MWDFLKPLLGPILNKLVDRIPDPNARARAKEEFESELLNIVAAASQAQTRINEKEAQHASIFVAGWRPFIGWVCGSGIAYAFVLQPFLTWAATAFEWAELETLPTLDTGPLMSLVLGMLGLGGLRTFEKMKGVSREVSPK